MTARSHELSHEECSRLLSGGGVGRIAFVSPSGQQIVPVSFEVHEQAIVCRTTPYSELGWHGPGTEAAFQTDGLDAEHRTGWSVVARGTLCVVSSNAEMGAIKLGGDPQPWAGGARHLYLKLAWRELTGRRIENDFVSSGAPVIGGRQIPLDPRTGTAARGPRSGQPPRW